ncbi:MAG: pyruvate formate lyase-activating protein [Dehalococcoidia bacterium]|nr:MAG: pyruvate formate lyase-activating protein [Dehalococcoidia bacterium]
MRLLCIDVGSGTQDILLLDTTRTAENAIQFVMPSPTVLVARRIRQATARKKVIFLAGETMGGGACTIALREHLAAGLSVYATERAARTFSNDLGKVTSWGVKLVSDGEAASIRNGVKITTGDVDFALLERAFSAWDVKLDPGVIGVAVLDHGAAPPGESERRFRFRYLEDRLKKQATLESLVYRASEVPEHFTRMQAVARSLGERTPLVLMDTGAAAVLGASLDGEGACHPERLAVNLGNSHTLAFHLEGLKVLGMFEHHTSMLSLQRLETLLARLVSGELTNDEVWNEGGHGALVLSGGGSPFLLATGPRRALIRPSRLKPCFAAPFGNMMLAGCFGLVRAMALHFSEWRMEIDKALRLD